MALVQDPVADDQSYIAHESEDQRDDNYFDPGHAEDAGDLVLHILQLGELDRAAGYELGGPVDVISKAERDLAQDGAGGDGCLERFSVALAVDDDIPIERGGVEVVGDERREDTVGAERDLAVVGGHGHVYLGYELGGAEDLADAEVLDTQS